MHIQTNLVVVVVVVAVAVVGNFFFRGKNIPPNQNCCAQENPHGAEYSAGCSGPPWPQFLTLCCDACAGRGGEIPLGAASGQGTVKLQPPTMGMDDKPPREGENISHQMGEPENHYL